MNKPFDLYNPVLITGKGGSGTRLLSRLIRQVQVFLGNKLNRQGDSLEWVEINRKFILEGISIKNGSFNNLNKMQLINQAKQILNHLPRTNSYRAWGLKLPEMLFMLPEMFESFEHTKLIHLVRHPIKANMRRTHITSRMDNPIGQWCLPRAYRYLNLNENDIRKNTDEINNAISWKFQLDIINDFAQKNLNGKNYLIIKFEDIIADPMSVLVCIKTFLGLKNENTDSTEILIDKNRIEPKNTNAILEDKIWEICGQTAEFFGYKR